MSVNNKTIAVVVPCYKVTKHIQKVIALMPNYVDYIICVDDCCPEGSGQYINNNIKDERLIVLFNETNKGVGGAVMNGFKYVVENKLSDIVVKIDGDGQMDPLLIKKFITPILEGDADYTKGNRFYNPKDVTKMPKVRLVGNVGLGFCNKFSSGYWNIFDPTNGYVAANSYVLSLLDFSKIHNRYFFETDMLYHLHLIKAKVTDIPMKATYADEVSNLSVSHSLFTFGFLHLRNLIKRVFFEYYLRDFSVGSITLPLGLILFVFGFLFGSYTWISNAYHNVITPSGTVMLSVLPIILGFQMLLNFLHQDMMSVPNKTISPKSTDNE